MEEVTSEELKQVMDDYGNIRYLIEDLKASRETMIQAVLLKHPEVASELEEIDAEIGKKIEDAEKLEKLKKKNLQALLDKYSESITLKDKAEIKSDLVRVGLEKDVSYDSKGLDGFALENPKILMFRNEKVKSRITLNSK